MNEAAARRTLSSWLDAHELTQRQLAALIGVDVATLERWLAGARLVRSRREWIARASLRGIGPSARLTVRG